jgi:hypothetical protein
MTAVALRALGFLVLLVIVGALGMYAFTKDRRWLTSARRLFLVALTIALIVAAFLLLERLIIAI